MLSPNNNNVDSLDCAWREKERQEHIGGHCLWLTWWAKTLIRIIVHPFVTENPSVKTCKMLSSSTMLIFCHNLPPVLVLKSTKKWSKLMIFKTPKVLFIKALLTNFDLAQWNLLLPMSLNLDVDILVVLLGWTLLPQTRLSLLVYVIIIGIVIGISIDIGIAEEPNFALTNEEIEKVLQLVSRWCNKITI